MKTHSQAKRTSEHTQVDAELSDTMHAPTARKIKPKGKNPLIALPDAGTGKFNELQYFLAFERAAGPVKTRGKDWYAFDGKAWRPTTRERFSPLVFNLLPHMHHNHKKSYGVLSQAEAKFQMGEEVFRGALCFDDNGSVLINIANGVLRVSSESIELLPHDPKYHFTACTPSIWHNSPQPLEAFARALSQILPDRKDQALLQWFAGYCLFPDCKQHELYLICYGKGGTGKSTLARAIANAFDDGSTVTYLSLRQICATGQGSYSLPALEHAIVNLGTELDTLEVDESSNHKQLVSGEPVIARPIYGKPFTMSTTCKHWFLSNVMPRFKSGTDAEYRRTKIIAFSKRPDAPDRELKEHLLTERDAIFAWCVEGLRAILDGIAAPEGSTESQTALTRFKLSNDPLGCFVEERCILSPELEISKEAFVAELNGYLDAYGFPHKAKEMLFKALYERYPEVCATRHRNRTPDAYIKGIGLR
jgi:putative DNA primase/helicase